jgi:integrase
LRWCERDKGLRAATLRDYRLTVRAYLLPAFGADTPLEKVTAERIEAWRDARLADPNAGRRTTLKTLVLLSPCLSRARRKGWIAANPCADVEPVKAPRPSGEFNVLDQEQVEAAARAAADDQLAALIRVAAYTGLRMGELRALRWRDVDFARRLVHVRRSYGDYGGEGLTKSGKARSVPMGDQAERALDGLTRREWFTGPDDLVFPSTVGRAMPAEGMRRGFYDALRAAGLGHLREKANPFRFHDLRYTFGTLMVQAFPLHDVQAYMGHAQVQTTMRYLHHVPRHDAADRMTRAFTPVSVGVSPDVSPNGAFSGATGSN